MSQSTVSFVVNGCLSISEQINRWKENWNIKKIISITPIPGGVLVLYEN